MAGSVLSLKFQRILDYIFPRRCLSCKKISENAWLCPSCKEELTVFEQKNCPFCAEEKTRCSCGKPLHFQKLFCGYVYRTSGRALMHDFKFRGACRCYDDVLKEHFLLELKKAFAEENISLVTSVPFHKSAKGRFSAPDYIAQSVCKELKLPFGKDALTKTRKNEPQHTKPANLRKENVQNVFAANPQKVRDKTVLLIDDIGTTLSTLDACAAALLAQGAKQVLCAVLFRTQNEPNAGGKPWAK